MIHMTLHRTRLLVAAVIFPIAALTMTFVPANAGPGVELAQTQSAPTAVDAAQLKLRDGRQIDRCPAPSV